MKEALFTIALFLPAAAGAMPVAPPADVNPAFIYNLASPNGDVTTSGEVALYYDHAHGEVYGVFGDTVRIFSQTGMEIFSFPVAKQFGAPVGLTVLGNGDIVTIAASLHRKLVRYSYRGDLLGELSIKGAPSGVLDRLVPDQLTFANGKLYVTDRQNLQLVVTDDEGAFRASYDIATKLGLKGRKRVENALGGLGVDREGNILFTVPTLFAAYVMEPNGSLRSFGARGSAPGKFNLVGAIAADDEGRVLVLDVLKSAVIIFSPDFKFLAEVGGRGYEAGYLIAPNDMVAGGGKFFVSQSVSRGVSVFRYVDGTPSLPPRGEVQSSHVQQSVVQGS
jgi:hypothetical protein